VALRINSRLRGGGSANGFAPVRSAKTASAVTGAAARYGRDRVGEATCSRAGGAAGSVSGRTFSLPRRGVAILKACLQGQRRASLRDSQGAPSGGRLIVVLRASRRSRSRSRSRRADPVRRHAGFGLLAFVRMDSRRAIATAPCVCIAAGRRHCLGLRCRLAPSGKP